MTGLCLALALSFFAAGCGGDETVTVPLTVTIAPSSVSALVSSFVQFALTVNGAVDSVTFLVNDVEGGNATVGTITTEGLYRAPAVVPAGTTITVKSKVANSSAGTSAEATATVTLDSGVRVSIVPASYTIGTNEQFQFSTKVRVVGVPPNAAIANVCDSDALTALPLCTSVTWSVAGGGSIDATTGNYTAPASTGTATVTATSIYDTGRSGSATVTLVTAADPTLTSISNDVGAVGATLQDIYLTGTNFISTTQVRANGNLIANADPISLNPTSTVLRVRLSADDLDTPGALTFTASRQGGADQACSTPCTLTLSAQRPAIVATTPESIGAGSSADVIVNGGYYGTAGSPTVTADFEGQPASIDFANRLRVASAGSSTPGLAPVTVTSNVPGATVGPAVANVAIQPSYGASLVPSPTLSVGKQPSSIAINTATGIAVVANQGSNSVALIDLAGATVLGFICTSDAIAGAALQANDSSCPASSPTSVAVDNLRNLALVTNSNSALKNVAVIDLVTQSVREIIPSGVTSIADVPWGVGINPLSGRAVVAYQVAGFASIIDLNQVPAAVTGLVAASTGPTPRVAVSPRLNWALVTPGGGGSMAIVDLGHQNTNPISSAGRSGGVVTITTSSPHTLKSNPSSDPVLITGVTPDSFNGVFNVIQVSGNTFQYSQDGPDVSNGSGGTASYSVPITVGTSVSVTGVGINDETQKAIVVDPTGPQAQIFSLLDQTFAFVPGLDPFGNTAGAFNPLTNIAVTVNRNRHNGAIIDPVAPALLGGDGVITGLDTPVDVAIDPATNTALIVNSPEVPANSIGSVSFVSLGGVRSPQILQVSRQDNGAGNPLPPEVTVASTLAPPSPNPPNPQTLRIIGSGFTGSPAVQLDGVPLVDLPVVINDRELTVSVPASMLTAGPRLYAVQVVNGGNTSNAATFTVAQSVNIAGSGCTTSAPQGVAIDYSSRNLAIVTDPGCNNVAIIKLGGASVGTGQTVAVDRNPQGVAVHIQSGLAVVANADDSTASIVDISGNTVVATVSTDPTPIGVAIDQGLGRAVVTAFNAAVINTFAVSSSPGSPVSLAVQSRPVAVAVDPVTHLAAVANATSNTISLVDLTQSTATTNITANGQPWGVVFDPASGTFLAVVSLANQLLVLDPVSRTTFTLRVGINPTSLAYNFNGDTLVTTNSSSQTMSVIDFLNGRVRAVLSFKPSSRFAVDIHPFTNLAVIADAATNRVILRPLPR